VRKTEELKREAACYAVRFVRDGMRVGLGHGSTTWYALEELGRLLKQGALTGIVGVPCSGEVQEHAGGLGIPLGSLDEHPELDLTIDGADEVSPDMGLIKGGGGALLREKIVAQASRREIIVVDESKLSPRLGTRHPVPVEVVPFGWRGQAAFVRSLGGRAALRQGEAPFRTDQGNFILDCDFGPMDDPRGLAVRLERRAGVVEHGLFLDLATDVVVAGEGGVRHFGRGEKVVL
jgi:ribose 5-phosphate isomerase A